MRATMFCSRTPLGHGRAGTPSLTGSSRHPTSPRRSLTCNPGLLSAPRPTSRCPLSTRHISACSSQEDSLNTPHSPPPEEELSSAARRRLLAGALCLASSPWLVSPAHAADVQAVAAVGQPRSGSTGSPPLDLTITHQVYLDVGLCATALKPSDERLLGSKSAIPDESEPLGRIVIGLYGRHVPTTVANFLATVRSGALTRTTFSRVVPGEYVQAGRQGSPRLGELPRPPGLTANPDLSSSKAFRVPHLRPGSVSLSLAENDEEPGVQERPGHHSVEFLITTGPGPVPRLDGGNIVFGRVLDGMNTVAAVAAVPAFGPTGKSDALNRLAAAIGDGRANQVRRKYGRPLRAIVITGAGELTAEGEVPAAASTSAKPPASFAGARSFLES